MNLVDYKGRSLEVGKRVCIQEDIPSANGMLYKNTSSRQMWNTLVGH